MTEDRKDEGLILSMSISANVAFPNMEKISHGGILNGSKENDLAVEGGERLQLKYGKITDAASSLSGGNQQKVVLAKWLATQPTVLLLDEPTRGVDVGAKAEIYTILRGLAESGVAILVVSSEMPELMRPLRSHSGFCQIIKFRAVCKGRTLAKREFFSLHTSRNQHHGRERK